MLALQKLTKRQKLRHALACQRLGLETPDSALLEVERPAPSADIVAESEPSQKGPLPVCPAKRVSNLLGGRRYPPVCFCLPRNRTSCRGYPASAEHLLALVAASTPHRDARCLIMPMQGRVWTSKHHIRQGGCLKAVLLRMMMKPSVRMRCRALDLSLVGWELLCSRSQKFYLYFFRLST